MNGQRKTGSDAVLGVLLQAQERIEMLEALIAKRHFVKGIYLCRYCWRADGHTDDCEARAALSAGSGGRETTT